MTSIECSGYPLVFRVTDHSSLVPGVIATERETKMQLDLRSLEGMQKEAVISAAGAATWRMVSDEGPYLNGTDLAPFPLAFFTAGQQFSLLSELVRAAHERAVALSLLRILQDNYYAMEGSFVRGDAIGSAMPADVMMYIESDAPADTIAQLVDTAYTRSAAHAVVRDAMKNAFALTLNGRKISINDLPSCNSNEVTDPAERFDVVRPVGDATVSRDIITKTDAAQRVEGVEGGVGSSLKAEQKRTLHVHGEAKLTGGMRMETKIQLIKPIGSSFRFFCDETVDRGGNESAPPPLAYLSAGIGFCYLTQLGRYAHITKQQLKSYRVVQNNHYRNPSADSDAQAAAIASPVETHVFFDADISDSDACRLVRVGERTCFLHAAMRGKHPTNIKLTLNGKEIEK